MALLSRGIEALGALEALRALGASSIVLGGAAAAMATQAASMA